MTKYEEFCRDMAAASEPIGTPFDGRAPKRWTPERHAALIRWTYFAVALVSDENRQTAETRCANALLCLACCGEVWIDLPQIEDFPHASAVADHYGIAKWTNRQLIDRLAALTTECGGLAEWSCEANYLVVMKSVVPILDRVVARMQTRRPKWVA